MVALQRALGVLGRICVWVGCVLASVRAFADIPPIPIEQHGYSRISTSAEIAGWFDGLMADAPWVRKTRLGLSVQKRPLDAYLFSTRVADAPRRLTVMIIGTQHGATEPAGGEALMVTARELVDGGLRSLLDDIDVVLIPNANPDGRDNGRRVTAHEVNINIDFVEVTQPETLALKRALREFQPDVVLDSHESAVLKRKSLALEGWMTDFNAQFEIANHPAVPAELRRYALEELLPLLTARVTGEGLPAHRYIGEVTSTHQSITNGGLTAQNFRNMTGLSGALSFLVETKLDPGIDRFATFHNIKVRMQRQRHCIDHFLWLMHERRDEVLRRVDAARVAARTEAIILDAMYARHPDSPEVKIPMRRLKTRTLELLTFPDHRHVSTSAAIPMPRYLLVTDHLPVMREWLEKQWVGYDVFQQPTTLRVDVRRFSGIRDMKTPAVLRSSEVIHFDAKPGMLRIDTAATNGRLAVLLLDPRSNSSLFRYPAYQPLLVPDAPFFIHAVPR